MNKLGFSQCSQCMIGNDVSPLTVVSETYPFVSIGTLQIKREHDKITRYAHNFVTCGIPSAKCDGCYAPKDKNVELSATKKTEKIELHRKYVKIC